MSEYDKEEENVLWVNCYEKNTISQYPFKTRKDADDHADPRHRIACMAVRFERGQGLAHGRLMK